MQSYLLNQQIFIDAIETAINSGVIPDNAYALCLGDPLEVDDSKWLAIDSKDRDIQFLFNELFSQYVSTIRVLRHLIGNPMPYMSFEEDLQIESIAAVMQKWQSVCEQNKVHMTMFHGLCILDSRIKEDGYYIPGGLHGSNLSELFR